jgi:hypothetical protein
MWTLPLHGLSQVGLLVVASLAVARLDGGVSPDLMVGLSVSEAELVLAGVLAVEAVIAGVFGSVWRVLAAVWLSVGLAGGSFAMLGVWGDWSAGETVGIVGGVALVVAVAAVWLSLAAERVGERLGMWTLPLHGLSQVGLLVAGGVAVDGFSTGGAAGVWSLILAVEATVAVFMSMVTDPAYRLRELAGVLGSGSLLLAAGAAQFRPGFPVVLHLIAILGAAALAVAARPRELWAEWAPAMGLFGAASVVGPALMAVAVLGVTDSATAGILLVGGAGLLVAGLRSGRWPISYVGMIMWLAAGLILGHEVMGTNRHAYLIVVALVALVIIDMERHRLARMDQSPGNEQLLGWLRATEWVVMGLPLAVAAADALRGIGYAGLLAAEAGAVLVWAIASRVRRRLLVGAVGLVAAILIPVATLAIEAGSGGVSTGAILGIGAGVALLLIIIGSLLEKGRAKVGEAVRRASEILEDWE